VTYEEAVRFIYGLRRKGARLHLHRIQRAVELRGHPERACPIAHIGGTNGKGSVSAMVASIGKAAGIKTGLFTSPHLHRFVERIRVDGRPLAERELAARVTELCAFAAADSRFPELTFYETATLLAFEVFRDRGCGLAVLEVGLGGRLDATNVVTPEVTAITRIARDHAQVLGGTLAAIAREKAGILKPGVPLVSTVRAPTAMTAIRRIASRRRVPSLWIDRDFHAVREPRGLTVAIGERRYEGLRMRLEGRHQDDNAACAVVVASTLQQRGIPIDERAIRLGVARATWPGRLERVDGAPPILLDAAHNPDGCRSLAAYLAEQPKKRRVLVFGAMRDKELLPMLEILAPHFDDRIYAPIAMDRAAAPRELRAVMRGRIARTLSVALDEARASAGPDGEVVVAGSIFLIASVRAELLGVRTEPLISM
jgi:dihydrofolate synthase/folylpolyglutamate synthase